MLGLPLLLAVACLPASPLDRLTFVAGDVFTGGQIATAISPDIVANGPTVMAAAESGVDAVAGTGTNIVVSVSHDWGATWTPRALPLPPDDYGFGPPVLRAEPSLAYSAKHHTWLLGVKETTAQVAATGASVYRSTDDGATWSRAFGGPNPMAWSGSQRLACDGSVFSPHRGTCYAASTVHIPRVGATVTQVYRTADGGVTWTGTAAFGPPGLDSFPVVQPDGGLVVVYRDLVGSSVQAIRSTDGGASFTPPVQVSSVTFHTSALGNPTSKHSVGVDAAGALYVAWPDCRFQKKCARNDIVMARSTDGSTWSVPEKVREGGKNGVADDRLLPRIVVNPTTSGDTARFAIAFYSLTTPACAPAACKVGVGVVSSLDGGHTFIRQDLVTPFPATDLPLGAMPAGGTAQPPTVGSQLGLAFIAGRALPAFVVAKPQGEFRNVAIYATFGGVCFGTPTC